MKALSKVPFPVARRMSKMAASAVREILKVTERPDIISFAGGLPAPELFPVEAISQAHSDVLAREGPASLQYSTTEGWGPLREWICARMAKQGIAATPERVLITSGSQQGIDLVSKLLLDPGDTVLVEDPTYLAALQTFRGFEAQVVPVDSDDDGLRLDALEQAIRQKQPKLIYVVSNFSNPKGTTLSLERRRQLLRLAVAHHVPILEDDPYGELRYRGQAVPSLSSMDDTGHVIYLSTFSKMLAPGLRVAWATGSAEVIRTLTVAKQATDLHTGTLAQRAIARLFETFDLDGHLAKLRVAYGERCKTMLGALGKHFPKEAHWTHPEGGMFLWAELPDHIRGEDLLSDALLEKVAFVPGTSFFAGTPRSQFIRLNFSNRPPADITEGIRRLGAVLAARRAGRPATSEVRP
jgi:2-aminoadipate transaminase